MRIFIDTADIDEIRQAARLGVISGVTTNPSLASKAGIGSADGYRAAVMEIADHVDGPISVEVINIETEAMIEEGWGIAQWHPNVVVKMPSNRSGFEAMAQLSNEGVKINQTLCFSLNQAILGAQAGAVIVGRLDDRGEDGMAVVRDIAEVFRGQDIETQVLAASIRHPLHCVEAARAGAHIATLPFKVLTQMIEHPLTDAGLARFTQDWERASKQE